VNKVASFIGRLEAIPAVAGGSRASYLALWLAARRILILLIMDLN
jgi:hypothetical protein